MDLFNQDTVTNILPYDGITNYHGQILSEKLSLYYYNTLLNVIESYNEKRGIYFCCNEGYTYK